MWFLVHELHLRAADFALVAARHRWGQSHGINEGAGIWTIPFRIVQVRGEIYRATGVEETGDRTVGETPSKFYPCSWDDMWL